MPTSSPTPSCRTSLASPCTSVGARTMAAPNAVPRHWWPRQTPSADCRDGYAGRARVARPRRDDDAGQGFGLGLRSALVGQSLDARLVDLVVAHHEQPRPRRLERLDEVEGKAVVVVDDEDHAAASAASWMARRIAAALCSVSSNSRSGTLPATMPAPVWRWATPSASTALRMVIAVSRLPS